MALMKNKISSLIFVSYFSRKKKKKKFNQKPLKMVKRTPQSIYVKEWQSTESSEGVMHGE